MTVEEFIAEWESDVPYITAHTSGSTGTPKLIRLPKDMVRASAWRTIHFFELTSDSHLHLALSPEYIAGKMMIVRALECGARLTCESPSNTPLACTDIDTDISLMAVVPSQLLYLLDSPELLCRIDTLLIGGSAMDDALRKRVASASVQAYESYGMTETASHVALRAVTASPDEPFTMLDGLSCGLTDAGALVIDIGTERYVTNDAARIVARGRFQLLGRLDNVIISGAVKIYPEELERELGKCNFDFGFYISSRHHPKWGEEVVMVTDRRLDAGARRAILSICREVLGHIRAPKDIIAEIPFRHTLSGKLLRSKFA